MTTSDVLERTLRGDLTWRTESGWTPADIVDSADQHGVQALVWDALQGAGETADDIRRQLEPHVRAAVTRDLIGQRELQSLLDAFAKADVRALLIKGTALAYTVYPHPWHRPRIDSDLLVSHPQLDDADSVLRESGYSRSDAISTGTVVSHQRAYERVDGHGVHHVIDLHWKIVNPQILADALGVEELWLRRTPALGLGASAMVPSAVDSVIIAAVHRLAHHQGHDRLIWLCDVQHLTMGFTTAEWKALTVLAERHSVAGLCLDALRQAHERLGMPVPPEVLATLGGAAPAEPSRRYLERRVQRIDVLESDLRMLPTWRARWTLLREHAFPPAAFVRQRYGVKSRLLLPAVYLYRLLAGATRWVR
jgi:hypothetical protein